MSEFGQKLIEEVRKVAEKNPHFVYPGNCYYVEDGQPGCLIGQALWRLGLIDESLPADPNGDGVSGILKWLDQEVDQAEEEWLSRAQTAQDFKIPWGECVL